MTPCGLLHDKTNTFEHALKSDSSADKKGEISRS